MSDRKIVDLNPAQQREALVVLSTCGSREIAADWCGCTVEDIEYHELCDPKFAEDARKSKLRPEMEILKSLMSAAKDAKQWRAAILALEIIDPDRYCRRLNRTINSKDVEAFVNQVTAVLHDELPNTEIKEHVRKRLNEMFRSFFNNHSKEVST